MFCQKCGSILVVKDANKKNKKRMLVCSSCGKKAGETDFTLSEDVKKKNRKMEIVEDNPAESLPLTDQECPECGHKKAYHWSVQTRASDEPETRFFRCEKCKHTWREYQ